MSKENCKWNDIQLTHEDDNIDYYVIINKPLPTDKYIPNKTIVFRMEPDTETSVRWNDWYKSKDEFMHFLDLSKYRNNSEWHLGLNYNQIKTINIEKTKTLSTVVSSLYNMEGHKKRIDFVKYLQSNDVDIDVYGRDNVFLLENHKGELPYHNKNNGILPYKYTFIAENCKLDNYFTEKIIDSIIGETLCFYWGCPNIEKFIDSKAFIRLDLDDFQQSLNVVQQAIENDEWSKRINIIKQEKEKIVNHYSFFPRIEGLIAISKLDCKVVNLNRRQDRWLKFQSEAKKVDFKNYKRFIAVDGENMIITSDTINMFRNFFNKPKKGEVGCALSHYNIWKEIENDTLVLEDDIKFDSNFIDGLALVYRHILDIKLDYDVVFIGYHLNKDVMNSITIQDIQNNKEIIVSMAEISKHKTTEHMFGYHGGGTFGYIISQKGAKKLLKSIEKRGFVWPVDYHMLLTTNSTFENDTVNMYCVTNPLVFSDMYEKNKTVDTDIQNTSYLF
jgi:GR25 family glycosyltransferase involved in LPS biosynthesis